MRWPQLLMLALFIGSFGLAARMDSSYPDTEARRANVLNILLGDSRRMFATHVFAKADAYFHSGYYPTIFDRVKETGADSHMEQASRDVEPGHKKHGEEGHVHDEHCEEEENAHFLGEARNWIDAFGRNFYPSEHTHLEKQGEEREMLPWLKLAADLDPHRVETYLVGSYTLRKNLGKPAEAEEFLRDGLRANPESYDILLELGKIQSEDHHDAARARNLWELALRRWHQQEQAGKKPDEFSLAQIAGHLGTLEESEGNYEKAVKYLQLLKQISPYKGDVEKRIAEVQAKMSAKK
jgi:tetratricopeptide (TPR) repeat protein